MGGTPIPWLAVGPIARAEPMRIQTTSMTTPAAIALSAAMERRSRIHCEKRLPNPRSSRHASTAAAMRSQSATTTTAKKFCSLNAVTTAAAIEIPTIHLAFEVRVISPATSSISAPARTDVASVLM